MRRAVLAVAIIAVLSSVVPAWTGAWAAGPLPAQDGGPAPRGEAGRSVADNDLSVIGLTAGQRLVEFRTGSPSKPRQLGKISGLSKDTKLVGIDFRVQDAKLYGVGDKGGIYTLNTRNAKAAKVSQLTVTLVGKHLGVDFNPAANRLRVISDTGQNLRHNIDDPAAPRTTTADTPLANPTTPPTTAKGVTGAAYTNNDLNAATSTSLFDIDTTNDRISLQSPANSGTLAPTGNLGVDAEPDAGFDIYFSHRTQTNHGFATLSVNGAFGFYDVNILTGQAASIGPFPKNHQVTDLALPVNQS
ncbi:DUF4394 domain-containing protein [Streptomyces sp. ISL-112]|uniref:DUF4394 domain-containing protein n=1 Tax=unclassified Streptomyces TaxID=2593676 RepID=UPI001BE84E43|nr:MULTISPECIES: DUF4394 domain-containing protein [unclassified Streptomyces]MBT2429660.1 DUF4394 domain-containing protein [Streptomyces sp. ISL-112]MBT2464777.1 DUF4394 domain-containing protein [Streptomyces sp. ISL-63]